MLGISPETVSASPETNPADAVSTRTGRDPAMPPGGTSDPADPPPTPNPAEDGTPPMPARPRPPAMPPLLAAEARLEMSAEKNKY